MFADKTSKEALNNSELGTDRSSLDTNCSKGLAPSLAALETYVAETNFAARKQQMFFPEVKNMFVSRTQILLPKHVFPSLASPGKHNKKHCFHSNVS